MNTNAFALPVSSRREFLTRTALAAGALIASPASLLAQPAPVARHKLIAFSKPFQNLNAEQTADTVAEVGWDGVDIPVRPKGQVEPERAADELPAFVEALKKRGKELTAITTAITSVAQPQTEKLLRLAARLGIRQYRLGNWHYDAGKAVPDRLREISAQLRELAALNQELGLQGGFQNHSGRDQVGAPLWDLWTMLKDVNPRALGVHFDIGHATIEGGMSWPIEARLLRPHFAMVYVKDFLWQRREKGWRAEWVMMGEGMVDRSFFKWLRTTNYSGAISQHHEYDHGSGAPMVAKMRKDLEVLREWLRA